MPPTATATVGLFEVPYGIDPGRLLIGVAASERERYRSLKCRPQRAQQYLASRWLLRAHLAPELGLPPPEVPLRNNANGPPTLPGTRHHLGLSHSGGLCLCITSTQACVGCDVEGHRPRRHMHNIARQFFHPAEATHLNTVDDDRARQDFYRLWTLKEAAQKALGRGLAGGLSTPAFALKPALRCLNAPCREPWTLASSRLGEAVERYSIALAIVGAVPPARFKVYGYTATANGPVRRRRRMHWDIANANGKTGEEPAIPGK